MFMQLVNFHRVLVWLLSPVCVTLLAAHCSEAHEYEPYD